VFWLHELHSVSGRFEDDFEAAVRDRWLPAVAATPGARLLLYLKQAFGAGPSYRVVTITGLRDAAAFGALAARVAGGDLASLARELDGLRHDVVGRLLTPLPWSPLRDLDLGAIPGEPASAEPALFMEDTVWPYEGLLDDYIARAGSHYAREMERRATLLHVEAAFRTAHGAGRRAEVVLWQRVTEPSMLVPLFTREVPAHYRQPGTWMHDALELRDQWESRLLRSAPWSPLEGAAAA